VKMIIPGGSGYLGLYLASYFSDKNWEVVILTRSVGKDSKNIRFVHWDGKNPGEWFKELDGADVIVNMAGRTVNCRYTKKNKAEILNSRIDSTKILGEAIKACIQAPKLWINSSSATYYRDTRGDLPANDEYNGLSGNDFSMSVCQAWEKTFFDAQISESVRKIALRTSIVLGKSGGAMIPILGLTRKFMGGMQGPGNQFISWVHIKDFVKTIEFLIEKTDMSGVINCAAPKPLINKEFMSKLRKALKISIALPMPTWLLSFGAILIQTESELILKSRKVVSKKLKDAGFVFEYECVEDAFEEIVG
jgi:uncharacterized protein (TIGR01777 family)